VDQQVLVSLLRSRPRLVERRRGIRGKYQKGGHRKGASGGIVRAGYMSWVGRTGAKRILVEGPILESLRAMSGQRIRRASYGSDNPVVVGGR